MFSYFWKVRRQRVVILDGQAIMEPFVERLYLTKGVYREKMESHQYKNKVIQSKTIEIHLYSCVKNLGNPDRI